MSGYREFKRDMENVAAFGWKLMFTLLLAGTAYAILRAIVGAIHLPTDAIIYVLMIVILGAILGVSLVTLARMAKADKRR